MPAYFVTMDVFKLEEKNRTCQSSSVKALCCGLLNAKKGSIDKFSHSESKEANISFCPEPLLF